MAESERRSRQPAALDSETFADEICYGDDVDVKPLLGDKVETSRRFRQVSHPEPLLLSYSSALAAKTMPVAALDSSVPRRLPVGPPSASSQMQKAREGRVDREENGAGDVSVMLPVESPSRNSQRTVVLAKEQTELVLKEQLRRHREELMLKDSECAKMHAYRDRVAAELEDLTATLFEEANKMVRDEKVKRHKAEKLYQETHMKLEALQTEILFRREQMSAHAKASSLPHRSASLHMLNAPPFGNKQSGSSESLSVSNVLQWFRGPKQTAEGPPVTHGQLETGDDGAVARKETDPIVHAEFVLWRQKPSLSREHPLINRIYLQEIEPNFEFVNLELSRRVLQAVENNTIYIEEGSKYKPFAKHCSLSCSPRMCVYRMKINDDNSWHPISSFARNRVTSVCDFFTYIRYIQLGLVRRGVHDTWWEIVSHREKMSKARLGVL